MMYQKTPSELYQEVLQKLLNFLSYKSRTRWELIRAIDKYLSKYSSLDFVDTLKIDLLEELEESNFIDDLDYACSFIREKKRASKPQGRFALVKFLRKKGVSKFDIDKALELEYPFEEELHQAGVLAEKKLALLKTDSSNTTRSRLVSYLLGRGFSSDIVYAVVDTKVEKG